MQKLSLCLLLVFVLLALSGLLFAPIPTAGAAWWNVNSQGNCFANVNADSWLNWDGYGSSARGETYGWLWHWTGNWTLMASGYTSYTGSPGNALVHNSHIAVSGWWDETGGHFSTFFSGRVNSDSGNFSCP